jgi:hypothetical protein
MARYGMSVISELTQWSGSLTRLASDLGQVRQKYVFTIPFKVAFVSNAPVEDKTIGWYVLSQCWSASAWLQHMLLLANDGMLLSFCLIDNSFNKLINQLQFNLFVVCG